MNNDIPFVDRFFHMEQEFSLFDLKDQDGLPIWDILRYDVYLKFTFPEVRNTKRTLKDKFLTVIYGAVKLPLSLYSYIFKKAEVIIFANPRFKVNELYIDKAVEDYILTENGNSLVVAQFKPDRKSVV